MAKIEMIGSVERVLRANGKEEAILTITIPVSRSADIPMGKVTLHLERLQGEMPFPPERKPTRGDRG